MLKNTLKIKLSENSMLAFLKSCSNFLLDIAGYDQLWNNYIPQRYSINTLFMRKERF